MHACVDGLCSVAAVLHMPPPPRHARRCVCSISNRTSPGWWAWRGRGRWAVARRNACCTLAAGDGAGTGGSAATAEATAGVGGASAGLYHTS